MNCNTCTEEKCKPNPRSTCKNKHNIDEVCCHGTKYNFICPNSILYGM